MENGMGAAAEQDAPTLEQVYAFLRTRYKHERFEGRNAEWPKGVPEGGTYAELVARNTLVHLKQHGKAWIGRHESATGEAVLFDIGLQVVGGAA